MDEFVFDLQRFDLQMFAGEKVIIPAGETYTYSGVTYTAIEGDITLNFNDTGTGLTVTGGRFSVEREGSGEALEFDTTDSSISFDSTTGEITIKKGTKIYLGGMIFTALEDIPATISINDKGIIYLTFENTSNKFEYELDSMKGTCDLSGAVSYKPSTSTIGLITYAEEGNSFISSVDLTYKNCTVNVKSQPDQTLIFAPVVDKDGTLTVTYPRSSYNTMQMAITVGGERVFSGHRISVDGTITFNPETKLLGMTDGTEVNFYVTRTDFDVVVKAIGKNFLAVSLSDDKITFTPTEDDGSANFSIKQNGESIFNVNMDISGGSFSLSEEGRLTFSEGTVITLDYGDSAVSFTVTDSEGGKLSLKNEGFTFTPYSDGGLKVTVLKGGEVPNATFDVTGEITYKLDSTILLAKGAVIENTFGNGNTLTVTALADTTSTINFTTQDGLTISSEEASEDLNIRLSNGESDIINITSVDGVLHYSDGTFIITDGTELSLARQFNYNVRTSGGNTSYLFDAEKVVCTPEEGATFVVDYLDETTWQLQNGTLKDYYVGPDALSVGSDFKCNDDKADFLLEDQGTYKLNGIKVNTHADNIAIKLDNYDTIITAYGICYTTTDENVTLDLSDTGSTVSGGKVIVSLAGTDDVLEVDTTNGSLTYDSATKTFHFTEGTTLSAQLGDNTLEFVAKNDFSISVNRTDDKVSFKLDGTAKVDVINGDRKATIDFNGALTYDSDGKISLEDGTEIVIAWEDGNKLKLTSHGSEGSIFFDSNKGVRITSYDDNLDLTLTTPYVSTDISHIRGTLYYKDGNVAFDENTKLSATTTLGGQPIFTTLETINGTGSVSFNDLPKGTIYSADTGAMKITWSRDDLESTFIVNKGSIQIGHNLFTIAEGTDLATDLKNFVPSLRFTTAEAGTYTINGQTIKTSAPDLKMVATDNYMTFNTSGNAVEYDGMNFAGAGNVSLSSDKVVLGAGVDATGFGKNKSFVLSEKGNVTADARIFELTEEVPTGISVTSTQDGFIFSRTNTEESEARFNNPNPENIGKKFTEEFSLANDDSYRVQTDLLGLQQIIGIEAPVTVEGNATFDGKPEETIFDVITESEGNFTIGKKTYNISGDSSVGIKTIFNNSQKCVRGFDDLNGTVSGDFTEHPISINGSSGIQIYGDTNVSIVGRENRFETRGLDAGASLQVSASDVYTVNSVAIPAKAGDVIIGTRDGSARVYNEHYIENDLPNTLVVGTELADTIVNTGTKVTIKALGGNDSIVNNVDSSVTAAEYGNLIEAGAGDDTIYNHHSYNPTLLGGTDNDSIVVSRGHKTFVDGGDGNDTIIGRLTNNQDNDWAIGGYATVLGGNGNDYIDTGYTNDSSINSGTGDDTIITYGLNNTINAGGGSNVINLNAVDREDTSEGSYIIFNGYTTVQGFATGFGEGTDTVYFENDAPGCNFIDSGLVLYDDDGEDNYSRLSFDGVKHTTKLNLYYAADKRHVKEVFINYNEWYTVESEDFTPDKGSTVETYFVGSTAFPNEGVNFNSISDPLNISLDTDYGANVNFWVNNIYSIVGGAGNTTITGSEKSDTIIAGKGAITINAAKEDDSISLNSASALVKYAKGDGNDTIYGFNANSTISISGGEYSSSKHGNDLILTVGDDSITIKDAANLGNPNIIGTEAFSVEKLVEKLAATANNVSVVSSDDTGSEDILLTGGDLAVVEDTSAKVNIVASNSSDTVVSQGENVTVKFNGGATDIYPLDGRITLENYDVATGAGFHADYTNAEFNNGRLTLDSAVITFADGANSEYVNFFDASNRIQKVGFVSDNAVLNASDSTDGLILIGGNGSTLIGGKGNDTIYAGDNSFVDGGGGNDLIKLNGNGNSTINATDGNDVVENFKSGFDNGDMIFVDADNTKTSFDGNNVLITSGNGKTTLKSVAGNDFAEIMAVDSAGTKYKTDIAKKDAIITTGKELANIYSGDNSAVDFTDYEGTLLADLRNSTGSLRFYGINKLTAGNGISTLIGSDDADTLIAGNGNCSIWSGAGNDKMVGKGGSSDKTGSTTFLFLAGDGNDTISDFEFLTHENSKGNIADKIDITSANEVTKVALSNNDVVLQINNNSEDNLMIKDAKGKDFQINNLIAKVDKNIAYDGLANCYVADGGSSVNVDSSVGSAEIWLDNSHGTYFLGDIRTLNASDVMGNTSLVGNDFDNTIIAGHGDSSLWGGSSTSDDLLIGGDSHNTFFYCMFNGDDTIRGANDGDSVILANIFLEQIISTSITADSVAINFIDGGSLRVEGRSDVTYQLADGSRYSANHETQNWYSK